MWDKETDVAIAGGGGAGLAAAIEAADAQADTILHEREKPTRLASLWLTV